MNPQDFYEAMNKPDALLKIVQVEFFKTMAEIRWDPANWLKKLEAVMGVGNGDNHAVHVRASFNHQGVNKVALSTRYVSNMIMRASGRDRFVEAIRVESSIATRDVVDSILESFGTTFNEEMNRVHRNIDEEVRKSMLISPAQTILIHPDKEAEVRRMLAEHQSKGMFGGIQVFTSPDISRDQVLMTDGTKDGSALLKNIGTGKPAEKKDSLQDAVSRRRRDAKWK